MHKLDLVVELLRWVLGCALYGGGAALLYIILRESLRGQKDTILRWTADKLHSLGWREELGTDIDAFFIEPRRGFGFARVAFVCLVAWRSYLQQNKTLLMLVIDWLAEWLSQASYHRHPHGNGLMVFSAKRTFTGRMARFANEYVVPFRWWLDDRQLKKRRKQ